MYQHFVSMSTMHSWAAMTKFLGFIFSFSCYFSSKTFAALDFLHYFRHLAFQDFLGFFWANFVI